METFSIQDILQQGVPHLSYQAYEESVPLTSTGLMLDSAITLSP